MLHPTTPTVGLFRSVGKGRHRQTVELIIEHGDITLKYVSPYVLDHVDWRIFLAAAALCGIDGQMYNGNTKTEPYPELWKKHLPTDEASHTVTNKNAIAVRTSRYELLKEAGLISNDDGGFYGRLLDERIERMSHVTVSISRGKEKIFGHSCMIKGWIDTETGEMIVSLNPIMAMPFLGEQHVRVSLDDMRQLKTPAAILLHGYLSARIRPTKITDDWTKAQRFKLDHLVAMVYGPPSTETNVMAHRRREVMSGINEIATLSHWRVHDLEHLLGERGDRTILIVRGQPPAAVAGPAKEAAA
jgi:hypothetical protein